MDDVRIQLFVMLWNTFTEEFAGVSNIYYVISYYKKIKLLQQWLTYLESKLRCRWYHHDA